MKYEIHPILPEQLHPDLRPVVRLWVGSNPVEACWKLNGSFRKKHGGAGEAASADDWVFAADVLAGCGLHDQAKLLARRAFELFPDSEWLAVVNAWDMSADGKLFECREALVRLKEKLSADWLPVLLAVETYNYSISGWRVSAEKAEAAALYVAGDNAFANYVLARAAARRSEWQQANELGLRALKAAPHWSRARGALTDSLLAVGQLDSARQILGSIPEDSKPFFSLDLSSSIMEQAGGDMAAAIESLEKLLDRWPLRSRYHRFAAWQLALLLMNSGQDKRVQDVVGKFHLRRLDIGRKSDSNRKQLISLPLVSQTHNHCVPTVAAMAAGAQGVDARPMEYAAGMQTRNGTPMWRMVDYMRTMGFRAECFRAEIRIIQDLLDQKIPLIGTLHGLFSSHVDVICGYDEGLQLLHMRDPMHWFGRSIPYDTVAGKYHSGYGLWGLVAPDRVDEVTISEEWLDFPGAAHVQLSRACSLADLVLAEKSFAAIPDDHPLALSRDSISRGIVITPGQFEKSLVRHAVLDDDPSTEQIRALLMRINSENAGEISELVDGLRVRLKDDFVDYVQAQCLMAQHRWTEAEYLLRRVTGKIPQLDSAWNVLSEICEQLGKADEAESCLGNALDISPDNLPFNRRLVEIQSLKIPFEQRWARARQIDGQFGDNNETCFILAEVLADSGDGLEYEEILKRCIRYFPRLPGSYQQLASWYLLQGREDLAGPVLKTGRELIGIDELPKWDFELSEEYLETTPGDPEPAGTPESLSPASPPLGPNVDTTFTARFESLMTQSADCNWQELIQLPLVLDLLKEDNEGRLAWLDSVRFRSLMLRKAILGIVGKEFGEEQGVSCLQMALPGENMPGIPEIYARSLLESLEGIPVDGDTARTLLDWIHQRCPNSRAHADLEFTRAWLLEQSGKLNLAEGVLKELIRIHPAYAPAWYRKGAIASSRNDFAMAVSHLNQAISIQPSLAGALEELVRLAEYLNDETAMVYREKMAALTPYSVSKRYLVALATGRKANSADAAIDYMQKHESLMGSNGQALMVARLYADFGQHQEALKCLEGNSPSPKSQRIADWIRVDCLVEEDRFGEALGILERMLDREPDDDDVADQLVRVLRQISPEKSRVFCEEKLKAGHALPLFAFVAATAAPDPAQFAIVLLPDVPEKKRAAVATSFSRALSGAEHLKSLMKYLHWISSEMPQLVDLQELYSVRLNMQGRDREATAIAKKLLERSPDDPRWLRLMGIVIQDYDAKQSVKYLEKEFAITGSAETLTRLARGHQLAGAKDKARDYYYRALALHSYDSLAISNLVLMLNDSSPQLYEYACGAMERGNGVDDQYFLIVCVMLAKKLGRPMPHCWFSLAVRRMEMVQAEGGFLDERKKLKRALGAWTAVRPADSGTIGYRSTLSDRLAARFLWPGHKWIPRN